MIGPWEPSAKVATVELLMPALRSLSCQLFLKDFALITFSIQIDRHIDTLNTSHWVNIEAPTLRSLLSALHGILEYLFVCRISTTVLMEDISMLCLVESKLDYHQEYLIKIYVTSIDI